MRSRLHKKHLVMATVPAALIISAIPAGVATAASQSRAPSGGASHQYIVILHNQNGRLGARSAARRAAVAAEQKPIISQLQSAGGHEVASTSLVNAVVVNTTASEAQTLAGNSAVAEVVPNQVIPGPTLPRVQGLAAAPKAVRPNAFPAGLCGTSATPQLNPEALVNIHASVPSKAADGAGLTVATIADGLDPTNPDFQRNTAYASGKSAAGSPVVSQVDFSGDAATVPTPGLEMFLDASSIAAQGNNVYDISQWLPSADPRKLPAGCDIKIVGDAPGAKVLALKVFSENNDTTISNFLQAINYAVSTGGAKVINESFGSNNVPDLAADVIRQADDAAVAAGVTVVVSSGDAGVTSTIGSPATDPNVISVGATTTFRGYEQITTGGVNVSGTTGSFVDNNIASLSSGGFAESGNTVDLVAPGDSNWVLCDNSTLYTLCTNADGTASSPIQFVGGTSEASPLVAGAAADVIQAYAHAHSGTDPTPAQVKQILMSSATDINSPASQQGAGLLNVAAAIKLAKTINLPPTTVGAITVSPNQINIQQAPGATTGQTISVTNTGSSAATVNLSTRALTKQVANLTGSFCMQPGTPTTSCPADTGTFTDGTGVQMVYKKVTFSVLATTQPSRLSFSADYRIFSTQTDLLNLALIEPNGTYAANSDPTGFSGFANVQVSNPPSGTWTALLYTPKNVGTTVLGAKGTIQWDANTSEFVAAGKLSATSLTLAAGATGTATLSVTSPSSAGDTEQSVVVSSGSTHTTIPVTVRTNVPTTLATGGTFNGVLTGGNGRGGAPAQANYYTFTVPAGAHNIHAEINLATDPGDILTGYLIDPNGQNLGYSTNVTEDSLGNPVSTKSVDLYHANPMPGTWTIALQWLNQVTGLELQEPFSGTIGLGALSITNTLPNSTSTALTAGAHQFKVTIKNTGKAPEAYFVDPRLSSTTSLALPNQNVPSTNPPNTGVDASNMTLPLAAVTASGGPAYPYYFVPTETSQISASLSASAPVNFDLSYTFNNFGDPDLEGAPSGTSPSVTFSAPEVTPGFWQLNPSEIGPYNTSTGAPTVTGVSASMSAVTKQFDPAVSSSTGDLWQTLESTSATPPATNVVYIPAGATATITVTITASGTSGQTFSGTLYVDDLTIAGFFVGFDLPNTDEVAAIPYRYKIS